MSLHVNRSWKSGKSRAKKQVEDRAPEIVAKWGNRLNREVGAGPNDSEPKPTN
jgi:hypothetical protein